MTMVVDKPRADGAAVGVDGLPGRARQLADLGDLSVLDPNVAAECRHAGPIHDQPVLYQQIVRHRLSSLGRHVPEFRSSRGKCSTRLGRADPRIVYGSNTGLGARMAHTGASEEQTRSCRDSPDRGA